MSKFLTVAVHLGDLYTCGGLCSADGIPKIFFQPDNLNSRMPTALLLDQECNFIAYGFKAERQFNELMKQNKQEDYFHFKNFVLLASEALQNPHQSIKAFGSEKTLQLEKVFMETVRHFVDILNLEFIGICKKEVKWIFSIPDHLNHVIKSIFRKACLKTGLKEREFQVIQENEANIAFCKTFLGSQPGSSYYIQNCGLQEMFRKLSMTGFPMERHSILQGTPIGDRIRKLLINIFGTHNVDEFEENYEDAGEMYEKFGRRIKDIENKKGYVNIRIGIELMEVLADKPKNSFYKVWKNVLQIESGLIVKIFEDTFTDFLAELEIIFSDKRLHGVKEIILVGDFADFVKNKIQSRFPDIQLNIPNEPHLCVLKGAFQIVNKARIVQLSSCSCCEEIFDHTVKINAHIKLQEHVDNRKINRDHEIKEKILSKTDDTQNGDILTTLPDPYRPMRIAQNFEDLYYTFREEFTKELKKKGIEQEALMFVTQSYLACTEYMSNQARNVYKILQPYVSDEDLAKISLTSVSDYMQFVLSIQRHNNMTKYIIPIERKLHNILHNTLSVSELTLNICDSFIHRCVENCCYMFLSKDRMTMEWNFPEDKMIDPTLFDTEESAGELIVRVVWPVIYLKDKGPILTKGIVKSN